MSFYTTKAFMLRENNGELGVELPSDIKELLKQRGLTVVFVSGDVGCDGEFVGMSDTMAQLLNDAPVITERLDVSERPIVCGSGVKPIMTMSEFIKFRDKMARPS